jgi:hypothetical protein
MTPLAVVVPALDEEKARPPARGRRGHPMTPGPADPR